MHLFSDAKDKHGLWIIELLFQSQVNDNCFFWLVIEITVLNVGLVYGKSSMLFWVVTFNDTIGGLELLGKLLGWFDATGLLLL